jgi:heterodisulfide reductase subunit C
MFDEEFTEQVIETGKIEEGRIIRGFFVRSGQPLRQEWLLEMARRLARKLPIRMGLMMGIAAIIRPRARRWGRSRAAIADYVAEQQQSQRRALGLTGSGHAAAPARDEGATKRAA